MSLAAIAAFYGNQNLLTANRCEPTSFRAAPVLYYIQKIQSAREFGFPAGPSAAQTWSATGRRHAGSGGDRVRTRSGGRPGVFPCARAYEWLDGPRPWAGHPWTRRTWARRSVPPTGASE